VRKLTWILFLILPVLAGWPAFGDEWNKKFTISGKADLRIDAADGSVTVRSWDRNEIEARVTTQGWRISPSEVRVLDRQAGDRVEIDVRVPRMEISFGRHSVHVELEVPRELRSEIRTGDGRILARDLKGEVHLSTGDGSIEVESIDGIFEAKTGDGHIRASGRWDRLDLDTKDGSIEADIRPGSKMTAGWRVRTGDGHVTLRLPENFGADLDAHTGDGTIHVDFPVTLSGALGGSEVHGKLNGGGEILLVRTGDGPIRLQKF
jgi:DUF4097 and DUF4098 domain-containing protein YvlB